MPDNVETRWTSFENPTGNKGTGGKENKGAKGHPFERLGPGETLELLNMQGAGIVNRIWLTISDRSPEMLRSTRIAMYWDESEKPAVDVPLGDFFGIGLGRRAPFENALFSDPEGRSFNSKVPMPFRSAARITLTNDSEKMTTLFYDINLSLVKDHEDDAMYFHAYWNRNAKTTLGEDYIILPDIKGEGRFLGTNIGIMTDSLYANTWWGEGEIKMYIDNDGQWPTLIGTGTEDYVGSAWGQGTFNHLYQGSLVIDDKKGEYAFYRYHIPDPVYFRDNIKVTIQQMGGAPKKKVQEIVAAGAGLIPVTADIAPDFIRLLEQDPPPGINDEDFPEKGWINFYRSDDISSTAYFYLDSPTSSLPEVASLQTRTEKLKSSK